MVSGGQVPSSQCGKASVPTAVALGAPSGACSVHHESHASGSLTSCVHQPWQGLAWCGTGSPGLQPCLCPSSS